MGQPTRAWASLPLTPSVYDRGKRSVGVGVQPIERERGRGEIKAVLRTTPPSATGKLTLNTAGTKLSANTTAKTLTIPVDLANDVTFGDPTQNGNLTFNTGAWTIKGATRQLTIDTITTTIGGNIGENPAGPEALRDL